MRYFPNITFATFLITLIKALHHVHAETYYCSPSADVNINGVTNGSIITRKPGESVYSNNLDCAWTIEAANESQVIQVEVISSHLQWSPDGSICQGYDYMQAFDGASKTDPEIVSLCGEKNPHFFTTSGSKLHIIFVTNDRNKFPFKGVQLDFTVITRQSGLGQCPPGWRDIPELSDGGDNCYVLRTHPATWLDAQTHCSYDQANLVSVNSPEEDHLIAEMVSGSQAADQNVWLSLNDIELDGTYKWLDGTAITTDQRWLAPDKTYNTYSNCVLMNKAGKWALDFCNEEDITTTVKHPYICEKLKVGKNEIFLIPSSKTTDDRTKDHDPTQIGLIVGCVIGGVVLITVVAITVVLVRRKKKRPKPRHSPVHNQRRETNELRPSTRETANTRPSSTREQPINRAPPYTSNTRPSTRPTAPPASQQPLNRLPPYTNVEQAQTVIVIHQHESPPPAYDDIANNPTTNSTNGL